MKKQRHHFVIKSLYNQSYVFSSTHVQMWELDHKNCWASKNWCFWTVVLKETHESPLDCKEIKLVNFKGNQPWIFIGRTDAEAEDPILQPPDVKNWLTGKGPDAGKDWRQEEKGTTEEEMVGWHHWLNGLEFEQASGVGDGQGSLVCCSPWGRKESDTTEWLNWTWWNGDRWKLWAWRSAQLPIPSCYLPRRLWFRENKVILTELLGWNHFKENLMRFLPLSPASQKTTSFILWIWLPNCALRCFELLQCRRRVLWDILNF